MKHLCQDALSIENVSPISPISEPWISLGDHSVPIPLKSHFPEDPEKVVRFEPDELRQR